jgi:hypothetical protein
VVLINVAQHEQLVQDIFLLIRLPEISGHLGFHE